jgi:hypothetical protein
MTASPGGYCLGTVPGANFGCGGRFNPKICPEYEVLASRGARRAVIAAARKLRSFDSGPEEDRISQQPELISTV